MASTTKIPVPALTRARKGILAGLILFLCMAWTAGICQEYNEHQIDATYQEGKALYYDGDYKAALKTLGQAREMLKHTDSVSADLTSAVFLRIAKTYRRLRYQQEALKYLDTAMTISVDAFGPDHEYVAEVYQEKAIVESQMMRLSASQRSSLEALRIYKSVFGPESEMVGSLYMNMAIDLYKMDEFEAAETRYLQAKEIFRKTLPPDDENHNRIYSNMGMLYRKLKDYRKALDYGLIALEYKVSHYGEDHPSVSKYFNNVALVYIAMGQPEQALPYVEKSVEIARLTMGEDHPEYAGALAELAGVYMDLGDPQTAYEMFDKCRKIIAARIGASHPYAVAGMSNMALCLEEMGRYDDAIRQVEESIRVLSDATDVYFPHQYDNAVRLAMLYKQKGDYTRSRAICDSLLEVLVERSKMQDALGYSTEYPFLRLLTRDVRADAYRLEAGTGDQASLQLAWDDYTAAIAIIGELRKGVSNDESQYYIAEECSDLYANAVSVATNLYDLTGDQHYLQSALRLTEESKSAVLRAALLERSATVFGGIPEEVLGALRNIEEEIVGLEKAIREQKEGDDAGVASLSRSLVEWNTRRDSIIDRIELEYPQYYTLKYAEIALDIEDLQSLLGETDRAVVSFYLLDTMGYAFYVSGNRFDYSTFLWDPTYTTWIQTLSKGNIASSAVTFDIKTCQSLSETLLGSTIEHLRDDEITRLVISPHRELCYLPFDLLRIDNEQGRSSWLVETYAVSYTHSMQLLNQMTADEDYQIAYAGFAPVYDWNAAESREDAIYTMRGEIAPLPATEWEVQKGSRLFGRGQTFIREKATYGSFIETADDSRILHLATHATVNPGAPLDSYLHFYSGNEEEGGSLGDRKLSMFEIYKSQIPAELVILSACQTGEGDLRSGEGPISLSRAFRYAGSRSVVMNQWPANDEASGEIVLAFLENIAAGQSKDIALQNAKVEYLANADALFAHPFFWAGLSLYGEVEPLEGDFQVKAWWAVLLGLVLAGLILWISSRRRNRVLLD